MAYKRGIVCCRCSKVTWRTLASHELDRKHNIKTNAQQSRCETWWNTTQESQSKNKNAAPHTDKTFKGDIYQTCSKRNLDAPQPEHEPTIWHSKPMDPQQTTSNISNTWPKTRQHTTSHTDQTHKGQDYLALLKRKFETPSPEHKPTRRHSKSMDPKQTTKTYWNHIQNTKQNTTPRTQTKLTKGKIINIWRRHLWGTKPRAQTNHLTF